MIIEVILAENTKAKIEYTCLIDALSKLERSKGVVDGNLSSLPKFSNNLNIWKTLSKFSGFEKRNTLTGKPSGCSLVGSEKPTGAVIDG